MPDEKISELGAYTTVHADDLIAVLDVHDTSMAPSGTDKAATLSQLGGSLPSGTAGQSLITDGASPAFSSILEVYTAASPNATGANSFVQVESSASGYTGSAMSYGNVYAGNYGHSDSAGIVYAGNFNHTDSSGNVYIGSSGHADSSGIIYAGNTGHVDSSGIIYADNSGHADSSGIIYAGNSGHADSGGTINAGNHSHANSGGFVTGNNCYAEGVNSTAGPTSYDCLIDNSRMRTIATIVGVDVTASFSYPGTASMFNMSGGILSPAVAGTIDSIDLDGSDTRITFHTNLTDHTVGVIVNPASATAAHAEGDTTVASAHAAHAEGLNTIASGEASHAEGLYTHASGDGSHAEGAGTATGYVSHAEGNGTAQGVAAHAEGNGTAFGDSSHAEGEGQALGVNSHAGGASIADLDFKWAHGDVEWWDVAGDAPDPHDGRSQSSLVQLSIKTTDATPTILLIKGGSGSPVGSSSFRPAIAADCACGFRATIVAREVTGAALAMFRRAGLISNSGGTCALSGGVQTDGTDINSPGWSVAITADDTNDALQIQVTGAADTTIHWTCRLDFVEVG